MADCEFKINVIPDDETGHVQFRVPEVRHPCAVRFTINGVSATSKGPIGNVNVVQVSADRVSVSAPSGTRIEVKATMECPQVEVAGNPDYEPCGPNSKSLIHKVGAGGGSPIEIVKEILRHLGLPVTLPWWLLWLIFFILAKFFKWLGADWPDPEEIKKQLAKVGFRIEA